MLKNMKRKVLIGIGSAAALFGLLNLGIDLYYYFVVHACPSWWSYFTHYTGHFIP